MGHGSVIFWYLVFGLSFFVMTFLLFTNSYILIFINLNLKFINLIVNWLIKLERQIDKTDTFGMLLLKIKIKLEKWAIYYMDWSLGAIYFMIKTFLSLTPEDLNYMERSGPMALRSVDAGRVYQYIAREERTREDGSVIPLDVALNEADTKGYTVFHVRSRTARDAARERDDMLVMRMEKGSTVQHLKIGSMDYQLLLSVLVGVDRLLPPNDGGYCNYCKMNHTEAGHLTEDGYFDYGKMREFAASRGAKGIYLNEIIVNHIPEDVRAEVAAFVRRDGTEDLGED